MPVVVSAMSVFMVCFVGVQVIYCGLCHKHTRATSGVSTSTAVALSGPHVNSDSECVEDEEQSTHPHTHSGGAGVLLSHVNAV